MPRLKIRLSGLMGIVVALAFIFGSLRFASNDWSGIILILTLGILGYAVMSSAYRKGAPRAFWFGFAIFGWIYAGLMSVIYWREVPDRSDLPTMKALALVGPYINPARGNRVGFGDSGSTDYFRGLVRDPDASNHPIWTALERPIPMPFPGGAPLEDVLNYIKSATAGPSLPRGLPIYVDPIGLQEAEKTMDSPIELELHGTPLRTSLEILLQQLEMTYYVGDGLVWITSKRPHDEHAFEPDAFIRIGHCWWVLIAGMIGGSLCRHIRAKGLREGI